MLQDVFLAFLTSPGLLRGEASAFTVLYQMATHKAVDRFRRRARRGAHLGSLGPLEEDGACRGGIGRIEAARDLQQLALAQPPRALTVALLHFVEGHTQEEVAEALGISRKTVGRILARLMDRARVPEV